MHAAVAKAYSHAFLQTVLHHNLLERACEDMTLLQAILRSHPSLAAFLRNPSIKTPHKALVARRVFSGHVDAYTLHFLETIIKKGRAKYIEPIAEQFLHLYRTLKKIRTVHLTLAAPIKPPLEEQFRGALRTMLPSNTIEILVKIDPSLIGGYIVRCNGYQLDTSLQTRLVQLGQVLVEPNSTSL